MICLNFFVDQHIRLSFCDFFLFDNRDVCVVAFNPLAFLQNVRNIVTSRETGVAAVNNNRAEVVNRLFLSEDEFCQIETLERKFDF